MDPAARRGGVGTGTTHEARANRQGIGWIRVSTVSYTHLDVYKRQVEGLGFLLITVAGPAALQRLVLPSSRDLAFALWSCYMPAGMAIAMLASPAFGDWHAYWWCAGAAAVIALGCIAALAPPTPAGAGLSWHCLLYTSRCV